VDQKDPAPSPPDPPAGGAREDLDRLTRDRFEVMRTYASLGSVGLSFVFAVVIGTGIGLWLDRMTGWSPAFTLIFFACGLVAGILNVYRAVSRLK
jgi:ATP synthase protein I